MKKIYLLLLLLTPLYCQAFDNSLVFSLYNGIYRVVAMPLVDEQKNTMDGYRDGYVDITQFPPLVSQSQIPSIVWVITPKNEKGSIDSMGQYQFILLNPHLCKPFDNGMPSYPVFEFAVNDSFHAKSANSGCVSDESNRLFNSKLNLVRSDNESYPNRFKIMTSSSVLIKEEAQSLVDDKRCTEYGKCEKSELKVRTYTQPTLQYINISNNFNDDILRRLPHSVPLYTNVGDQIPLSILPSNAPFLTNSTLKKNLANVTWIPVTIPPNMIRPSPYFKDSIHGGGKVGLTEKMYVKAEDLTNGDWVLQKAKTSKYYFKVACLDDSDSGGSNSITDGIAIYQKGNKEVYQLITGYVGESHNSCEDQIEILDANFDGYLDIKIPTQNGGAGPNSSDYFFIFDAKTKKFKFNKKFSDLVASDFDPKRKEVTSSWRGSCCEHGSETYRFINGKMVLVKTWHDYWIYEDNGNEKNIIQKGRLVNGKMRVKKVVKILKTTESK